MTRKRIVFAAGIWCALGVSCLVGQEARGPSDFRKGSVSPPTIASFSYGMTDLRLLFCSDKLLKDRIAKSVCIVDNLATFQEIEINDGDTIDSVVRRLDYKVPWDWQLRLIRMDAIEQTPVMDVKGKGFSVFREKHVSPGDIVIVTSER